MSLEVTTTWKYEQRANESGILTAKEVIEENKCSLCYSLIPSPLILSKDQCTSSEEKSNDTASVPTSCELFFVWKKNPMQCKQIKINIVCSARHVELYVTGTRTSLLGEEEQSEVYLGTFRGLKVDDVSSASSNVIRPKNQLSFFEVKEAFDQRKGDANVLKSMEKLRVKFVSLTGDKSSLTLKYFHCNIATLTPLVKDNKIATPKTESSTNLPGINSNLAGSMSNLSICESSASLMGKPYGGLPPMVGGMDTSFLMGMQLMLEKQIEQKIMATLDSKLQKFSQRISFIENKLKRLSNQNTIHSQEGKVGEDLNISERVEELEKQLQSIRDFQENVRVLDDQPY